MNETWKVALKCFAPIHKILKVTSQMASASDDVVLVRVVPPPVKIVFQAL